MSTVTVIVETPRGSSAKYVFDPERHAFELKKLLPLGMVMPFDFGFVPGTKAEDGDPLDVVVLSEIGSFPGCVVECRVIGIVEVEQTPTKGRSAGKRSARKTVRNDRILAVPEPSVQLASMRSLRDLDGRVLDQLDRFFENYHRAEGTEVRTLRRRGPRQALARIDELRE